MISNYNFEGIINGFILDETLIDCNNVICDVNSQILTISKKMYNKLGYDKSIKELDEYERFELLLNAYYILRNRASAERDETYLGYDDEALIMAGLKGKTDK